MYFERQIRKTRPIPLTSLIDIMFFLLLFFMLSTSFVRNESLELTLPDTAPMNNSAIQRLIQIYVTHQGTMYIGHKQVTEQQLIETLRRTFQDDPDMNILLLTGPKVSMQQMITVMDRVYIAGGKNLSVANWAPPSTEHGSLVESSHLIGESDAD